jgi:hypothetical protein
MSEKIALGVGMGLGLPGAIVAIWQMWRWINGGGMSREVVIIPRSHLKNDF